MKKAITLVLTAFLFIGFANAQSKTFENVLKMDLRNKGHIMENDNLVGYYYFYLNEKINRKTDSYLLQLLDNNLSLVKTIEVERPRNSYLLEMVFNTNTFMMMFFTAKGNLDLVTYDKSGTKLGEKNFSDLSRIEKAGYMSNQDNGTSNASIYPIGTTGFVRQSFAKNDKIGYRIEAYDNSLKELWVFGSDEKSKLVETADIIYSSPDYVALNVLRKKNAMTKQYDLFFVMLDAKTGAKVFEKPLKDNNADLSLLNCFVEPETNSIIIGGEYYAPGEDQGNSKSQGMYFMTVDLKGTQTDLKKLSWALDFAKMKTPEDEAKSKKNMSVYFHNLIHAKDGKWYAIGEQYKKQLSGLGMASQLLNRGGGGVSAASIWVYNMVVVEFDKSFNILNINTIEKKRSEVLLPAGAAYMSSAFLAMYVKAVGGFDYSFTSKDPSKDQFSVVYLDLNRKDSEGVKADKMIGAISYKDDKISSNRFPLNTDGTSLWISPAKPGYIAVAEYFKKKKSIQVHLEKINY